jgi:hypothetical protein
MQPAEPRKAKSRTTRQPLPELPLRARLRASLKPLLRRRCSGNPRSKNLTQKPTSRLNRRQGLQRNLREKLRQNLRQNLRLKLGQSSRQDPRQNRPPPRSLPLTRSPKPPSFPEHQTPRLKRLTSTDTRQFPTEETGRLIRAAGAVEPAETKS